MINVILNNKNFETTLCEFLFYMDENPDKLIGSAIFTKNSSFVSKIVCGVEKFKRKSKSFIPSHTGSIVEKDNRLYVFDMKPLRAKITPLKEYLQTTKDDFIIVIKNFELNNYMFSQNIIEHTGEFYPFASAVGSVFSKRNSKWRRHVIAKKRRSAF